MNAKQGYNVSRIRLSYRIRPHLTSAWRKHLSEDTAPNGIFVFRIPLHKNTGMVSL